VASARHEKKVESTTITKRTLAPPEGSAAGTDTLGGLEHYGDG
jgi:hypothetical protein